MQNGKDEKDDGDLLDKVAAAKLLNLPLDAIGVLRRRKLLPFVALSERRFRYRRSDLDDFVTRSMKPRKK